jgi:hypothetical protein
MNNPMRKNFIAELKDEQRARERKATCQPDTEAALIKAALEWGGRREYDKGCPCSYCVLCEVIRAYKKERGLK